MKYLVIALLALVLGGLIGREIWRAKEPEPVDPVHIIVTQLKTHAVIQHERQIAIWYRACPDVLGKTPQIFIAWPARLSYQLELRDVQVTREGTVIKVRTAGIHADEPSVATDFMDAVSTTSVFTFANEQELVNHEIGKATPIARYLTTYFLTHDPSLPGEFSDELQSLVEHLASALNVPVTSVQVEIPKAVVGVWPKLPRMELCAGSFASVNGMPFAQFANNYTIPLWFRPPASGHMRTTTAPDGNPPPPATVPRGIASVMPTR